MEPVPLALGAQSLTHWTSNSVLSFKPCSLISGAPRFHPSPGLAWNLSITLALSLFLTANSHHLPGLLISPESLLILVSPSLPFESSSTLVAVKWTTSPIDPLCLDFPCLRSFHTFDSSADPWGPQCFSIWRLYKEKREFRDIPAAHTWPSVRSQVKQRTCP